jgi:two-component system LytT family sensor kinase
MQVRWRQYELIFAITVFLFLGFNDLTGLFDHRLIISQERADYNYLSHTLLPFMLSHAMPLLMLLLINTWLLPRYLYTRHQYILFPITGILGWILLTATFAWSHYIRLDYLRGKFTPAELRQTAINQAAGLAGGITIIYILYLFVRESIIQWVNRDDKHKAFRVLVCNRITAVAFIYFSLLIFMINFKIMRSDAVGIFYLLIVLPVIIIVFINLYGLFPYQHRKQLTFFPFAYKLLIAPFVIALLAWIWYTLATNNVYILLLPAHGLILTIIATPVSWILFIQQKEKLVTLQQLKKDLGKTTADLAFLRSQINPHFLFNTLNTLYGTALQENATRTSTGIQRLGDMMRFLLHDNHRNQIPLSRELEYLQNYIALQQLRIVSSQGIQIETSIQDCNQERMIVPMLLIPFVENAFKHGIRLTSPSYIRIHFHCDDKGIYLDVVNSLHVKKNQEDMPGHSGIGLQNVQQRLQLLYPDTHTLLIHQDDTAFEIHLHIALSESK